MNYSPTNITGVLKQRLNSWIELRHALEELCKVQEDKLDFVEMMEEVDNPDTVVNEIESPLKVNLIHIHWGKVSTKDFSCDDLIAQISHNADMDVIFNDITIWDPLHHSTGPPSRYN